MFQILYNIFIMPIESVLEIIFYYLYKTLEFHPGLCIIFVSLAVNVLVLPLYNRADMIQENQRAKQKKMDKWNEHIRRTFKGDERYLIQSAYYRIENYKPYSVITGSISLLLQIPFFMAAYHFLSNLDAIVNVGMFGIYNLGAPDGLININNFSINLLPILMTIINIVSGMIYTKGFKLKDKIQLYGMAIIFMILLYNSPAGLVLYWTCNNVFSLCKNIYTKLVKDKNKGNKILVACCGISVFLLAFFSKAVVLPSQYLIFVVILIGSFIPLVLSYVNNNKINGIKEKIKSYTNDIVFDDKILNNNFFLGTLFLFLFIGLLIPTSLIAPTPIDFGINSFEGPIGLIIYSACFYFGLFVFWLSVFYLISDTKVRRIFSYVMWIFAGISVVDFYAFFGKFGVMDAKMIFEDPLIFNVGIVISNIVVVISITFLFVLIMSKWSKIVRSIYFIALLMVVLLSTYNIIVTQNTLKKEGYYEVERNGIIENTVPLSKDGKNVVVIMLDRAISGYIPYIFKERPELSSQYTDFVYYPNTVSFGAHTNYASPALYGGYEYTPLEINARSDEKLVDKHNESLKVLPSIFSNENYRVDICDAPLAGYQEIPDMSIFDDIDNVNTHITANAYLGEIAELCNPNQQRRNLVFYNLFRAVPVFCQKYVYDGGDYLGEPSWIAGTPYCAESYAFLNGLDRFTYVDDSVENTFVEFYSSLTHNPTLLENENYSLDSVSSIYLNLDNYIIGDEELYMDTYLGIFHYDVNIASYILIGKWLDYLKDQGIYDNTRIIIVSDHGYDLGQLEKMIFSKDLDAMFYNPVLLVKDFADSTELLPEQYENMNDTQIKITNQFMTNADVPYLATKGIVDNPINPYTGNSIYEYAEKYEYPIITTAHIFDQNINNGNQFITYGGQWYEIRGNIFDKESWVELKP